MSTKQPQKAQAKKPAPKAKKLTKVKGVSPVISELMVIDCLSVQVNPNGMGALQSGALLSVVDSYDRRILRENFVPIASISLGLHTAMGRMDTLLSVRGLISGRGGDRTQEEATLLDHIDKALQHLVAYAEGKRSELKQRMELVIQCPTAEDTVS